jgi:hypothetical protein
MKGKRVITNVIRFREDSKRRPHDFNIGKSDETLGEKKIEWSGLAARSEDRSTTEKNSEPLLVQGTAADGSNK